MNHTFSSKGVDVKITSAYYDGAVIGVTFSVEGTIKTKEDGRIQGLYEIFNGKDGISDSKEIVYMEPSGNGYIGHIQISYPKTELPPETSFPLEFKRIGEKDGSWRFDVPINQLLYETVTVDEGTNNEDAKLMFILILVLKVKLQQQLTIQPHFPLKVKMIKYV